jgi:hypothetical protein
VHLGPASACEVHDPRGGGHPHTGDQHTGGGPCSWADPARHSRRSVTWGQRRSRARNGRLMPSVGVWQNSRIDICSLRHDNSLAFHFVHARHCSPRPWPAGTPFPGKQTLGTGPRSLLRPKNITSRHYISGPDT